MSDELHHLATDEHLDQPIKYLGETMSPEAIDVIKTGVADATNVMRQAARRLVDLETALNRMIQSHENAQADSEGRYPALDSGCIECTGGSTPDRYNTGPCAYHNAKRLLGHD